MNRKFFFHLIVSLIVLLAATSALTWRSSAAQLAQEPVEPRVPDRLAALAPEAPVPGGPGFQMVNAYQFGRFYTRPYLELFITTSCSTQAQCG